MTYTGDTYRKKLSIGHPNNHVWYEVVKRYVHNGVVREPYIMLQYLYVRPEDRKKGIATQLLQRAMGIAKELDLPMVLSIGAYADKPMTNKQLSKFYRKLGFTRTYYSYMRWEPNPIEQKEAA